jgi:hypothetical protein
VLVHFKAAVEKLLKVVPADAGITHKIKTENENDLSAAVT